MLPYNADNLQDDESAPPPAGAAERDDLGEEVAPTLSTEAVEALDHLGSRSNPGPEGVAAAGASAAGADTGADGGASTAGADAGAARDEGRAESSDPLADVRRRDDVVSTDEASRTESGYREDPRSGSSVDRTEGTV